MTAETHEATVQKDALTPKELAEIAKYLIDSFKEALLGAPASFRKGNHAYQVYCNANPENTENTLSVYRQKTLDSVQIVETEGMRIRCNIDGTPSENTGIYWNSSVKNSTSQNSFETNTQTAADNILSMLADLQV